MLRLLMGIKHTNFTFHDHTSTFCQVSVTHMKLRHFLLAINQTRFLVNKILKYFSLNGLWKILYLITLDYNSSYFVGSVWILNSQNHISFIWHMSLIKEMRNCWIEMLACRKGECFNIGPMKTIILLPHKFKFISMIKTTYWYMKTFIKFLFQIIFCSRL